MGLLSLLSIVTVVVVALIVGFINISLKLPSLQDNYLAPDAKVIMYVCVQAFS